MTDQLPPLPELPSPSSLYATTNRDGDPHHIVGYTNAKLREYGQACAVNARKQALEEVLAIVENTRDYTRFDAVQAIKELK